MLGFDGKEPATKPVLDGLEVENLNPDLSTGPNASTGARLTENLRFAFMGTKKVGAFDLDTAPAADMLRAANPHGRPNSDVLRPFRNGSDLVRVDSHRWVVDFGVDRLHEEAAHYEAPFEYLVTNVKDERERNNDAWRREHWWLLGRTLPAFRRATNGLSRYLATPCVSKHRVFCWLDAIVIPDGKLIAIALDGDYHFGVLQSGVHAAWVLVTCGWHGGERQTYNPTVTFETFPFPWPPGQEPAGDARVEAIAEAAKELDELRRNWLNPPEWVREEVLEFPGSADGPWARYVHDPDARGIGTVRYPRLVPKDGECAAKLKLRTLTNLYNERPTWLALAHDKLDAAVFAAYGWEPLMTDEQLLAALLGLNLQRAGKTRDSRTAGVPDAG